jgi:SNF2 family DNA or RNA helicase
MGLGKTFGGSEKMVSYGNRVNLIICQKSKVNDWANHVYEHYEDFEVYDLTKKDELTIFMLRSDDEYESAFYEGNPICGVINYELAWRRPQLKTLTDFTLMLDESSLIQNRKAKQTKFILALKPKNVILLSGTPTAGKYENLWTQAHLLGWQISEDLYNRQYVNWKTVESDGFFHKIVDMDNPYKNVERLKQKFRDYGAVFMKTEEVFDLPGQTFTMVTVPTSKEYRKFIKTGYVQMPDGSELIGDQVFTKRLYSRQLCGMYSKAKLEAFKELIQSTNDRVIVFYNFNRELEQLNQIALDLGRPTSWVNGQEKDLYCYEHYDNSVTLIQYQAGAMGLNLQKANKIIYFTLPERSDLFEQSKARIHRIGQERPCFYWIMTCEGSVEEMIHQTLQERKDFTDDLFTEIYQQGRKTQ